MKKFSFLFMMMVFVITVAAFSQAPSPVNKNALHDSITRFIFASRDVVLPDAVYTIFRNYATSVNLSFAVVKRNENSLRALYNDNISLADRVMLSNFLLENADPSLPAEFVKTIRKDLLAKMQSNK